MKNAHSQRGASLPETAIVIGVLLLMIAGIIDFGRLTFAYSFVAQTARQGARWASVRGSQCTILDHCNAGSSDVQNYAQGLVVGITEPSGIGAQLNFNCPNGTHTNAPGCTDVVSVSYNYKFTVLPFLASVQIPISSSSQMVISN